MHSTLILYKGATTSTWEKDSGIRCNSWFWGKKTRNRISAIGKVKITLPEAIFVQYNIISIKRSSKYSRKCFKLWKHKLLWSWLWKLEWRNYSFTSTAGGKASTSLFFNVWKLYAIYTKYTQVEFRCNNSKCWLCSFWSIESK